MPLQLDKPSVIDVPGDRPPAFPAIYAPMVGMRDAPPKFGFSLDASLLARMGALAYRLTLRPVKHGGVELLMARASSSRRPEVVPCQTLGRDTTWYDDGSRGETLRRELDLLRARNLGPDRLFDGLPMKLVVRPIEVTPPKVAGRAPFVVLALERVMVLMPRDRR